MIDRKKYTVKKDTGCWEWNLSRDHNGYGRASYNGKHYGAHRLSYMLHTGEPLLYGMVIMHTCDNPCCINPEHLRQVTQSENVKDCWEKGRRVAPLSRKLQIGPRKPKLTTTQEAAIKIRRMYKSGLSRKDIRDATGYDVKFIKKVLD